MNAVLALEILSPIPKEDFITDNFTDRISKCCAVGHLVRLTSKNPENFNLSNCRDTSLISKVSDNGKIVNSFRRKTAYYMREKYNFYISYDITGVNNCDDVNNYTQDNPKDRVIALLNDMIEDGWVD